MVSSIDGDDVKFTITQSQSGSYYTAQDNYSSGFSSDEEQGQSYTNSSLTITLKDGDELSGDTNSSRLSFSQPQSPLLSNKEFAMKSSYTVDKKVSASNSFDTTTNSSSLKAIPTSRKVSSSREPEKDDIIISKARSNSPLEKNIFESSDEDNDRKHTQQALSSDGKKDVPQASTTKKSSKLPTIATSTLIVVSVASAAISVYVKMLMVGVAIGACCLVAAAIVYYTSRPTKVVENSHTEPLINGGIGR